MTLGDSLKNASSHNRNICIKLPKDYGTFIMKKYYENPSNFADSYSFIHNVCAGFYYRIISGNGTMFNIDATKLDAVTLNIYFRYKEGDSITNGVQKMATTEEVLQNTRIENKNMEKLLEAENHTYLKTPAGIYTEVTLPIDSIYNDSHINDTINSAKISFSRINDDKQTTYNLPIPQNLLMVKADELYSFFEKSKVADGSTSYVTSYSEKENAYTFNNISALVSNLYAVRKSGAGVKASDSKAVKEAKYAKWEAEHPTWNKVLLVPVNTTYSQQTIGYTTQNVLSRVRNDLSLSSTRLAGGNSGDIKISVIYSRFKK